MKKSSLLVLLLFFVAAINVRGQESSASSEPLLTLDGVPNEGFGAGLMVGDPFGVSLKYWLNETWAIDGGLGYSWRGRDGFHIHSDVLYHFFDLIDIDKGRLPLYFGVGARVHFERHSDDHVGIRGPVGVAYLFEDKPVDVFLEVAPVLDFTPDTKFRFTAAAGARYWFR
ncbi:MAG TPA: hypothetical protein VMS21_07895 [Methylomirabilota bacterium]|nr:hypothetical protein [Methylomirabilota bacterium]